MFTSVSTLYGIGNEGKCANAWFKTLVSCAQPGQPATTKVNLMSKSHTTRTFWDVKPCRHLWLTASSAGTETGTCDPSMAPIAPLKWGQKRSSLILSCSLLKVGSVGFMISFANFRKHNRTSLNFVWTVQSDRTKWLHFFFVLSWHL